MVVTFQEVHEERSADGGSDDMREESSRMKILLLSNKGLIARPMCSLAGC
jgi:hypothetical protein